VPKVSFASTVSELSSDHRCEPFLSDRLLLFSRTDIGGVDASDEEKAGQLGDLGRSASQR
jgi:hypothetical protein